MRLFVRGLTTIALLLSSTAFAQTPLTNSFLYQGSIRQNGQVLSGSIDVQFNLYDAPVDGLLLGSQTVAGCPVIGGVFTVQLNAADEFGAGVFNGDQRWLEIVVNDAPILPRQEIQATPYALKALSTPWTGLTGVPPDLTSLWSANGADIYYSGGNVGIGTASPASKLDIVAGGDGTEVLRLSTDRPWVFRQIGTGSGAFLELKSTVGLKNFQVTAAGGTNIATFDANDASPKLGVARVNPVYTFDVRAAAGIRLGLDANGGGSLIIGNNTNDNRIYVEAFNSNGNGSASEMLVTGFQGQPMPLLTVSATTTQVLGKTNVVTATGNLGLEHTDGTRRISTYVDATGGWLGTVSNHPLKFFTADGGAAMTINTNRSVDIGGHDQFSALTVVSALGRGITAQATSAGGVGLTAIAGPGGTALVCAGNFSASGTKSFRIDHPADPENRYLRHYCIEGPEPLNVYSGTVTSDDKGECWVHLPDYFESINKNFRYALTVVDDSDAETFVQAKVARKIKNNAFKIRTSAPNVEVSWRVEAVRNDLYVRVHGAPVEEDKSAENRGTFLQPELYGMPQSRGEFARPSPNLGSVKGATDIASK